MRFHLAPMSDLVTMTGQIEVRHILEGRNLVTLADTAKIILNVEWEVLYALLFGTINFDLE